MVREFRGRTCPRAAKRLAEIYTGCWFVIFKGRGKFTMPRIKGQRLMKFVDQAVCSAATVVFDSVQFFNKYRPNPTFIPKWSDKPLLKSWQKTKPQLGWPRQTDSLCPECVKEARSKRS